MKKYIYAEKENAADMLSKITRAQMNANAFYNVSAQPYRGRKLDREKHVTITVG